MGPFEVGVKTGIPEIYFTDSWMHQRPRRVNFSDVSRTFLNGKKTEAQWALTNSRKLSMAGLMMKPISVGLVPIIF